MICATQEGVNIDNVKVKFGVASTKHIAIVYPYLTLTLTIV